MNMENIPVIMLLEDLTKLPNYKLPKGYTIRNFKEGDKKMWAEVETAAGEFTDPQKGVKQFEIEFEKYRDELKQRLLMLENEKGKCIGTSMGWFDDNFFRSGYGRVHWVGIHPDYQGKGLAKPLVSKTMEIIKERHDKCYLTTQTVSFKAIKIYLDFGFVPYLKDETCPKAWKLMAEYLNHPALEEFR
ncbi:GNAT family N-acetyltransferase [Draconibacterium sp.]|nr:GNAT family N-acetyltransferase [Draconibacterium sp.]